MAKLHFPARAPNRGALLLGQHLLTRPDMLEAVAAIERRIGVMMVQRIISGEVIPAGEMDSAISAETNGAVPSRAWRQHSDAPWAKVAIGPRMPTPRGVIAMMPRAAALPSPSRWPRQAGRR